MSEGEFEGESLEFTPTWVVAAVCAVIIGISLGVENLLHFGGKYLKKKKQKPLFEALQKVKEELMLLGFISLLLTAFHGAISRICVHKHALHDMLPCKPSDEADTNHKHPSTMSHTTVHLTRFLLGTEAKEAEFHSGYCAREDKVPLLSLEALHSLHIFIFVLAIVHVTCSVLTVVFGSARIHQWKHWEASIAEQNSDMDQVKPKITHVHQHSFIKEHFRGVGKYSKLQGWMHSLIKQFYGSVTRADYVTLRSGFIESHCRGNPKFDFHRYMLRALKDDFKDVVGISWYFWIFVVIFLLLNIHGWHIYFWIAFIPFLLLLAVGAKLEHVMGQLAHEVAERHVAIEGDLVVQPSDEHFWFRRPHLVLLLIHFILFQNAFEISCFFWIWVQFGFHSCIMGKAVYIFPRLFIGVFIQILCSYSTLPLYALVTQMGSSFKRSIFDEHVQASLIHWAKKAKRKKISKGVGNDTGQESFDNDAAFFLAEKAKH